MLYAPKSDETKKKTPELAKTLAKLLRYEQSLNIAFDLDEDQLDTIAQNVKRKYDIDKASRSEWEAMSQKAMDVALQVRQPKNYPFEGAANIKYPLVTVAALQFGRGPIPPSLTVTASSRDRLSAPIRAFRSRTRTAIPSATR
jgi:hypothetical protein